MWNQHIAGPPHWPWLEVLCTQVSSWGEACSLFICEDFVPAAAGHPMGFLLCCLWLVVVLAGKGSTGPGEEGCVDAPQYGGAET